MKYKKILKKLLNKKIINKIDIKIYKILKKKENFLVRTIIILLIYSYKKGKIFLNTNKKKTLKNNILKKIYKIFFNIKNYYKIIKKSKTIGTKKPYNYPIIFYKKKFYFNKIFLIKKNFFNKIFNKNKIKKNINKIKKKTNKIKKIFKENKKIKLNKLQKTSIIMSIINKITFIFGGPGTGKTTIISVIIFFILQICIKIKKIKIASLTGRASSHLLISIQKNLSKFKIKKKNIEKIPKKSYTIHSLLKINPGITYPKFNKKNKLNIDLLIIDECSMISLILLNSLIKSTKKKTKIIFLGDFNQLPPINDINIIKQICKNFNNNFSKKMLKILKYTINYHNSTKKKKCYINDNVCILKKNYRFKKHSGIYKISNMILKNKINKLKKKIQENKLDNIFFKKISNFEEYKNMIKIIFKKYKKYWNLVKKNSSPKKILEEFNKIRVICAIKKGFFGIKKINKNIKKIMIKKKIIKKNKKWYIGKPIIIKKNQRDLNIFNGYIGILLYDRNKNKKIFFKSYDNNFIKIPKYAIKHYEVAWSITIHKSQGSEFKETIIIIPNKKHKILNKNLIYTAITRTKKKTIIFSDKKIFLKSIK
ncbi:exodeoxyribonuclease V subunit alpha [Buchnera aphidicola (Pseudoregma panicola)]|uniref:exodeoxyribonuclease V subunit alpha n=1 Tax=Buchnera aphidicola TaxID=9 RepID=UPI0031B73B1D